MESDFKVWGLEGRPIFVTGGNRGIGKEICLKLGQAKAFVGVVHSGRSPSSQDQAQAVCDEVQKRGGKACAIACDLSQESSISQACESFLSQTGGKIYGIVNNGGMTADQLAIRLKTDQWDQVLDANLRGAFLVVKNFLRPLMKEGQASVVNMSSVVGQSGNAGQSAYCASKAGLIGLTKSLALEYASKKVRFNCVAPGFVDTDMTRALNESQRAEILAKVPLNELGSVEDIAFATLYLLSPLSRYVTGQVLGINGGMYM
jgi:3-oxoacyl-[acyl-carrier protein] reductase